VTNDDKDGDGVADAEDDCPNLKNAAHLYTELDVEGVACDDDNDNDGV
jgi:hypothetical protein